MNALDGDGLALYAIDNASGEDSIQRLKAEAPTTSVIIANETNLGVAVGNHQGIRAAMAAREHYVLLINNDVTFGLDFVDSLVREREQSGEGMIAPKIYYHDSANVLWCCCGYLD